MTTTQEQIDLISRLKAQADAQLDTYTKVSEAHQIVLDRLNGIIETPAADYVAIRAVVATLTSEKASVQSALEAEETAHAETQKTVDALTVSYDNALAKKDSLITESVAKDTQIEELQAQVEALIPKPEVPVDIASVEAIVP